MSQLSKVYLLIFFATFFLTFQTFLWRKSSRTLVKLKPRKKIKATGQMRLNDYTNHNVILQSHELLMKCPSGWLLHVVTNTTIASSDHQACFAENATQWICADGWEHVEGSLRLCERSDNKTGKYTTATPVFTIKSQAGGPIKERLFYDPNDLRRNESGYPHLNDRHGNAEHIRVGQSSTFGLIRHPCTRLIEYWKLHESNSRETEVSILDKRSIKSFNTFVEDAFIHNKENVNSLPPQVDELLRNDGRYQFHQLLVFERLDESLEHLLEKLGENVSSIQTSIASKLDKNVTCQKVYTLNSWDILTKMYAIDFCVLGYSGNIGKTNIAPHVNLTKTVIRDRYKRCKVNAAAAPTIPADDVANYDVTRLETNDSSCVIFAYYDDYQDKSEQNYDVNRLVDLWKEKWTSAGWEPHVISMKEARRHPDFEYLMEKFKAFPTLNSKKYELSCFMRYLAMAVVGGGWMSDYDVLPYDMPKCMAPVKNDTFTVYGGTLPALLHGASSEYTRVARLMADIDWKSSAVFTIKNSSHVSDMLCIQKLAREGVIHSEWVLMPASQIFSVPFDCDYFTSTAYYTEFVKKKGGHTTPLAIHYSHSFFKVSKAFIASQNWNFDMRKKSNLTRKIHEFYVKECKHRIGDEFNDPAFSNVTMPPSE